MVKLSEALDIMKRKVFSEINNNSCVEVSVYDIKRITGACLTSCYYIMHELENISQELGLSVKKDRGKLVIKR